MAWSAHYKAWGEVKEQRSEWAQREGLKNPIRFQGQYHDHETGLHYNRYRYYYPQGGRFISKDPISYAGGLNLYVMRRILRVGLTRWGWLESKTQSKAIVAIKNLMPRLRKNMLRPHASRDI